MTRPTDRRTRPGKLADPQAKPKRASEPEAPPLSITLRDLEVPQAPVAPSKPASEEFIVSDPEARRAPWLGDPEAERAAQRAARRAQVRKDRLRDVGQETTAGDLDAAPAAAPSPSPRPAPSAIPLPTLTDELPPIPAAPPTERNDSPVQTPPDMTPQAAPSMPPGVQPAAAATAGAAPAAEAAPTPTAAPPAVAKPAAPAILVLRPAGNEPDPLYEQLRAFGFDVQVQSQPPDLPAPWPFVAVFVDQALHPVDGGDAMDLCNDVRERSRLPGVLKPVLVLVADQLTPTNRVRAGLAGCNEILLGAITRGAVAKVLDTRGIALPSDARRA